MGRLFVSHSSHDNAAVERLRPLLAAEHVMAFIDFDPAIGIPAGRRWEDELNWQLASCVAVLYLCSRNSNDSKWCFAELAQARARRRPVIAIRLDGAELPSILTDTHAVVDFSASEAELRQRLAGAFSLAQGRAEAPFPWDGSRPLYPGMMAFDEADAAIFFGRDKDTDAVLELLEQARVSGRRLVCVAGASGSGKSSVVRAGVLPRLRRRGDRWIVTAPVVAGPGLAGAVAESLVAAFPKKPPAYSTALKAVQAAVGGDADALDALLRRLRQAQPGAAERVVVLVMDQAERAFATDAQAALSCLLACAAAALPLVVLLTLRLDHLDALQARLAERSLATDLYAIGPLPASGIAQVIEGPAALARIEVERELVATLVDEARGRDGLALLAFALRELWQGRGRDSGRITLADYRTVLGGLEGAVARCVERTWSVLRPSAEQMQALRGLLLRMASLGEGGAVVGRAVALSGVPAPLAPIVTRLVDERLLLTRGSGAQAVVEVVHEALFRAWAPLAEWVAEAREVLAWRRDIGPTFSAWRASGRDIEAAHLGGHMLEAAARWRQESARAVAEAGTAPGALDDDAELIAFVDASLARGAAHARRAAAARVRHLAAQAQVALALDPAEVCERGLLLAIEAMQQARDVPEARLEADQGLRQGLALLARTRLDCPGGPVARDAWALNPVHPLAVCGRGKQLFLWFPASGAAQDLGTLAQEVVMLGWSRDGDRAVGVCEDGWLVLWQVSLQKMAQVPIVLPGNTGGKPDLPGTPTAIAFSADGALFAVGFTTRTLVWAFDVAPITAVPLPVEDTGPVLGIDFAADREVLLEQRLGGPANAWRWRTGQRLGQVGSASLHGNTQVLHRPTDGRFVLTAGGSWEVWLWDSYLQERRQLADNGARVAWSRDGQLAAMASPEHFARLWRTPEFTPVHTWRHGDSVWHLDFSPDGTALATAAGNGVVHVWDTDEAGGERARVVCPGGVQHVRFAADDRTLVTQRADGSLAAWDTQDLRGRLLLRAEVAVLQVAFSADGRHLAIGARRGPGHIEPLWMDLEAGRMVDDAAPARAVLEEHAAAVRLPLTSASARTSVVALGDKLLGLFDGAPPGDAAAATPRCTLAHDRAVTACAFSPDESTLATLSERDHVRLWSVAGGHEIGRLSLPAANVAAFAFSPDGRFVATAGSDGVVRLWHWQAADLIAEARTRLTRELTAAERERHMPEAAT
ncbi:MAG: TIR domain-containing protein [Rubrivivax sp.]|nr:TIR domain-containing protein [Rubrivivax sp.]